MASFKELAVNMSLIGIFAFAILFFGAQLSAVNNANQSILDDDRASNLREVINSSFDSYDNSINSSEEAFSNSQPTVGGESLQISSVANIWKSIITVPYIVFRLTLEIIFEKIFSDPAFGVIFIMVTSLVVVIIMMYAWQFIRGGTP